MVVIRKLEELPSSEPSRSRILTTMKKVARVSLRCGTKGWKLFRRDMPEVEYGFGVNIYLSILGT